MFTYADRRAQHAPQIFAIYVLCKKGVVQFQILKIYNISAPTILTTIYNCHSRAHHNRKGGVKIFQHVAT